MLYIIFQVLTLASNERVPLTPSMRLLFEISHLKMATPATVSRAGILFVNQQDLGWNPWVTFNRLWNFTVCWYFNIVVSVWGCSCVVQVCCKLDWPTTTPDRKGSSHNTVWKICSMLFGTNEKHIQNNYANPRELYGAGV